MADATLYDDRIARLRLIRTAGIGPVTYRQLIARFGTPAAALAAVPDMARRGGGKAPAVATLAAVEAEVAAVERLGARYLFVGQGLYPPLLAHIETAPPALILRGRTALLERQAVAIVGARNASAAAVRFARGLAAELADAGYLVVSGLARGIDTAAHAGAGAARTAGVIAGGIDIVYPPENADLQRAIGDGGLLLAEQPPGTEPRARHFPYRNRIIAGLAGGTVVVEAAPRSGSLITARLASEFGRDVMAVPGSPLDPRAQGCNLLIREGAVLVQSAADVIEAIGPIGRNAAHGTGQGVAAPTREYEAPPPVDADDRDRTRVVGLLGPTAVGVDEIVRQAGLAPAIVQTVLLELELGGRLDRHAGGRVSLSF
nr:DNA-processing protein DprA [Sphingomonas montana]